MSDNDLMHWQRALSGPLSKFPVQSAASRFVLRTGGLSLLVLVVVSCLIAVPIRSSIRTQVQQTLQATLRSDVVSLERWALIVRNDVEHVAVQHQSLIRDLLNSETGDGVALDAPSGLRRQYAGWALLNTDRTVLRSSFSHLRERQLPIAESTWQQIFETDSFVAWPFRMPIRPEDSLHSVPERVMMMGVIQPIFEGGRPLGGYMLLMDPIDEKQGLWPALKHSESAETLAFDRNAQLMSPSRFEAALRDQRRLPAGQSSILNVSLRHPDGTLTTIADQATRGGSGTAWDGVDDYRGVPVMAAWQWIPEYQIGVVTKIDLREAMSPWRWLWWAWLGGLVISAAMLATVAIRVGHFTSQPTADGNGLRSLGQYDLRELVGKGGMGAVYRGSHQLLKRDVAIKVLEAEEISPQAAARFEREVQMTARLRHPNTIDIYDYGRTDDGTFFYVMEFVEGITLQELVHDFGPQPPERVIHLLLQICGSLGEAHQLGMIHRDIKPSNILLTASAGLYDMIKVLDFGLVKKIDEDTRELTHTDGITGTPMYMSPESVRDATTADQRSDLYSVGAVGYTLLTGRPTFDGDSSVDVCLKQLKEMPVRPEQRLGRPLPDDLQNVLMSCLRKDPKERPRSIEDLQLALRQCEAADRWTVADALQWWEIEFVASHKNGNDQANGNGNLTGKGGSATTAR